MNIPAFKKVLALLLMSFIMWRYHFNSKIWLPQQTYTVLDRCLLDQQAWRKAEQEKRDGVWHIVCLPDTIQPPFVLPRQY